MGFKNLEHEGDEDFLEQAITKRNDTNKISKNIEERRQKEESQQREKDQARWLNFNNPALWDGEI